MCYTPIWYTWSFVFYLFLSIKTTLITNAELKTPHHPSSPVCHHTHSNPSMYNLSKTYVNMSLDLFRAHHFLALSSFSPEIKSKNTHPINSHTSFVMIFQRRNKVQLKKCMQKKICDARTRLEIKLMICGGFKTKRST